MSAPADTAKPTPAPPKPPGWDTNWLFFRGTEKFFKLSKERQLIEKDVPYIGGPMQVDKVLTEFNNARTKVDVRRHEAIMKKSKKLGLEDYDPNAKLDLDMYATVAQIIWTPLKHATILRICEQAGGIALASVFKLFATSMKKDFGFWIVPLFWIGIGAAITFMRGLLNEHSMAKVCGMKAKTGQILRGLLFKRLQECSWVTLDKVNAATLAKMLDYEFGILANWIGIIPVVVTAPVTLCLAFTYLMNAVGMASCIFLGVFIVLTLVVAHLHSLNASNTNMYVSQSACRAGLLNEMLPNMREIKTACVENKFYDNFMKIRGIENVSLRKMQVVNTIIQFFLELMPLLCTFGIIVFYNVTHTEPLSAVSTFTVVTLLGMLAGPLAILSNVARDRQLFDEAYEHVSAVMNNFEERPQDNLVDARFELGRVQFDNVTFGISAGRARRDVQKVMSLKDVEGTKPGYPWSATMKKIEDFLGTKPNAPEPDDEPDVREVLTDITTDIQAGNKICLIGTEGSGRSSFMLSILGEINKIKGDLKYNGKVAYLNMKNPLWLIGESLMENVIVGAEYDHKKFQKILNAVQLDVSKFPGRALVKCASDGSNFNESEQRKILIARCLYNDSNIYLFDGVFDPLDASEKKDFFTRICLRWLRDKTVIFTGNERTLARLSDKILVFDQGELKEEGNIDDFDAMDSSLFDSIINADNVMGGGKMSGFGKLLETAADAQDKRGDLSDVSVVSSMHTKKLDERKSDAHTAYNVEEDEIEIVPLMHILKKYMFSVSEAKCAKEVMIIISSVCFALIGDIWLGCWSANALGYSLVTYLMIYALLNCITACAIIARNLIVRFGLMENGDVVYDTLVTNILKSKLSWYERNPASRIVHRLTADTNKIDTGLSSSVIASLELMICVMAGLFIFNVFYFGLLILCTAILMYLLYGVLVNYLATTGSFYQVAAINRARLGGVYIRLLKSAVQLRAVGKGNYLDHEMFDLSNRYQSAASHLGNLSVRWIGVRSMFFGTTLLFMCQSFPLLGLNCLEDFFRLQDFWKISMAIAWSIKTIGFVNKWMDAINDLSIDIITLEKSYDWIEHEEIEVQATKDEYKKDSRHLAIDLNKVSMIDGDGNHLLNECSLQVRDCERVGLLGDAGSGKFEIPVAILGLQDVEYNAEGSCGIKVYNRPVDEVKVGQLRKNCAYLYTNAKLFAGTVRDNLDPTFTRKVDLLVAALHWLKVMEVLDPEQKVLDGFEEQYGEIEMAGESMEEPKVDQEAPIELQEVQDTKEKESNKKAKSQSHKLAKLAGDNRDFISFLTTYSIPSKTEKKILVKYLDSKVEAEGKNFEESQRKIILIAKELFKQPDVLFMEEGCIDVPDLEDKYYFDAIFDNLKGSTIVTVLNGFDYLNYFDMVYWLKDGQVVEKGSPKTLLDSDDSLLCKEVKKTSKKQYKFLLKAVGINRPKKSVIEILKAKNPDDPKNFKLDVLLRKLFDHYDEDGSGEMDRGEITSLLSDTCKELDIPMLSEDDLEELINYCDESGDGLFNFDELFDMIAPILEEEM